MSVGLDRIDTGCRYHLSARVQNEVGAKPRLVWLHSPQEPHMVSLQVNGGVQKRKPLSMGTAKAVIRSLSPSG